MKPGRFLSPVLLIAALLLALIGAAHFLDGRFADEGLALAEQAIRRGAVQCYALEGAYPPNLAYLRERYGVAVDPARYFVDYRYIASNLMPDITIFPLRD